MCTLANSRLPQNGIVCLSECMQECIWARACTAVAAGITSLQELMRRVSDGAARLCQRSMEERQVGSLRSKGTQVSRESKQGISVDGKMTNTAESD